MEKKRISFITIFIIGVVILVIIGIILKLFVFDKNVDANNNQDEKIMNISGEENVEYDGAKKINISGIMQNDIYMDDFTFNNFYIYSIDGVTRIEFDVSNDSSERKKLNDYKMKIYGENDEYGEIICTGEEFAAGQTKRLSVVVNADVANLSAIDIESTYSTEL